MVAALKERPDVARRKLNKPSEEARDRIDLRADPAWIARLERQAARMGQTLSSYIRRAVTKELEADEASDPSNKK